MIDVELTYDEQYEFIKLYDILRDMDFELTPLQRKYDRLLSQRREFIKQWKEEGRVYSSTTPTKVKVKKEDKA